MLSFFSQHFIMKNFKQRTMWTDFYDKNKYSYYLYMTINISLYLIYYIISPFIQTLSILFILMYFKVH